MTQNMFSSLLVANRGEIALRVLKTARAKGLRGIAVHTDADADSPHVAFADQAIRIGEGPVADSYLSIDALLEAARQSGAEAVHPGYGFLSENTDFARACADNNLIFVGPPAAAVALMGDKARAKSLMIEAGLPTVPGYEGDDQSAATLAEEAAKIGFPVMIKASAGGGGRGMRRVEAAQDFAVQLDLARAEALGAFGSDHVILEKALIAPRHVEIQIFADQFGHVVHLAERDCSIQRRHQKIIEEAPCPILSEATRKAMGNAAIKAARAVDYVGAGTVEFLLDQSGAFYFLEMNTRLQVEHPVTEMITGLDLVALQLDVAAGCPLPFQQEDLRLEGHAIEARLYAEDPLRDFLPQTGIVRQWRYAEGTGLRVDSGISEGQEVTPFYDPMLAKIIGYGPDRDAARRTLVEALRSAPLLGLASNRDFLIDLLSAPRFLEGSATTSFIEETYGEDIADALTPGAKEKALLVACAFYEERDSLAAKAAILSAPLLNWSSGLALPLRYRFSFDGEGVDFTLRILDADLLEVSDGVQAFEIEGPPESCRIDGEKAEVTGFLRTGDDLYLATSTRTLSARRIRPGAGAEQAGHDGLIRAPMHGNLQKVMVAAGDEVHPGMPVAILEAMKMQHEILAEVAGVVREIAHAPPVQVKAGDLLMDITPKEAPSP